jgi:hypothetical protein
MDDWDPLVAIMVKLLGVLTLLAFVLSLVYVVVKYAVRDGMRLARAEALAARERP